MSLIPIIAANLHTQDNRITANPIFMVQVKVRERGDGDNGDPHYWVNYDWDQVDDSIGALLDAAEEDYSETFIDPEEPDSPRRVEEYTKVHYLDVYHHHMPFFTEAGAQEYIRINGHNLREPRIYVESGYRNAEWEAVRAFLMAQTKEGWKS